MNKQTQERATRRAESRRKKIERNSAIYDAYTRAGSVRLVADEFGVTHETVRQAVVCEKRRRMKEDKPVENVSKTSDRVEVVRCRDCKHRPTDTRGTDEDMTGFAITFPDDRCLCKCEDGWYNWYPDDNWFCANGERRDANA